MSLVLNNQFENENSTCGAKPTLTTSSRSAAPCLIPSLKRCQRLRTSMKSGHLSRLIKNGCQLIINKEVPLRQNAQRFNQPWTNQDVRRITLQKGTCLRVLGRQTRNATGNDTKISNVEPSGLAERPMTTMFHQYSARIMTTLKFSGSR